MLAVYAGLRPLVAEPPAESRGAGDKDGEKPTTKLSREHVVDAPLPGLVSIAGGKFTTYRLMARDVVDAAVADLPGPVPAVRDGAASAARRRRAARGPRVGAAARRATTGCPPPRPGT